MASEVGICNLALAHLTNKANISALNEQSAEAQYCSQFYPIARDQMLASHTWDFCTKRAALSLLTNDVDSWAFAYGRPGDCLNPISVLLPESIDDTLEQDYVQELNSSDVRVIRTNVEFAVLRYTKFVTDTTRFSPLFVVADSFLLGSYLAGPITKDMKLKETLYKIAMDMIAQARAADANSQQNNAYGAKHIPDFTGRDTFDPFRNQST